MSDAIPTLRERAEQRIYGLVNRGREICAEWQPRADDDMALSCGQCGYTADVHMIRDLLAALVAVEQHVQEEQRHRVEAGLLTQAGVRIQALETERDEAVRVAEQQGDELAALQHRAVAYRERAETAEAKLAAVEQNLWCETCRDVHGPSGPHQGELISDDKAELLREIDRQHRVESRASDLAAVEQERENEKKKNDDETCPSDGLV